MAYNPVNPNGQASMADSTPVVIASDQSAVPVSAASLPLPTGAASAALQTQPGVDIGDVTVNNAAGASAVNIQDGGNSLTVDYATTGSGTATGALRVELPTDGTGVVGLNAGTNAIGKLAANSGVDIGDVDVTSLPVAFNAGTTSATTQRIIPATGDTGTLTNVSASATSVTLAAANTSRTGLIIVNDSTSDMYLKFGSAASTTSYTFLVPAGATYLWEETYNGIVTGIWNSATGTARVTEVS